MISRSPPMALIKFLDVLIYMSVRCSSFDTADCLTDNVCASCSWLKFLACRNSCKGIASSKVLVFPAAFFIAADFIFSLNIEYGLLIMHPLVQRPDEGVDKNITILPGQTVISFSTSGRRSAILINVFAARDGSRRPCSHCSSVRFDTPISVANWLWERPVFMRALATSVFGSTTYLFRLKRTDFKAFLNFLMFGRFMLKEST